MDCEGCEADLLTPRALANLGTATVIVELHDFATPGDRIVARFEDTHDVPPLIPARTSRRRADPASRSPFRSTGPGRCAGPCSPGPIEEYDRSRGTRPFRRRRVPDTRGARAAAAAAATALEFTAPSPAGDGRVRGRGLGDRGERRAAGRRGPQKSSGDAVYPRDHRDGDRREREEERGGGK